jgi:hypothetical protein
MSSLASWYSEVVRESEPLYLVKEMLKLRKGKLVGDHPDIFLIDVVTHSCLEESRQRMTKVV